MPTTTLLIDADILVYKAAVIYEETIDFGDIQDTIYNFDEALEYCNDKLKTLKKDLEANHVHLCFSASSNWRKELEPTYKANRKGKPKPKLISQLRKHLQEIHSCISYPRLEADDVMGILATEDSGEFRIIVSSDKDMKTIPGLLYNDNKDALDAISEEEADYWHMYQTLIGDSTDGYKGCPKVGDKKATKWLAEVDHEDYWFAVRHIFECHGHDEEEAIKQARLARILRSGEYNKTTKKVKLWKP